MFFFIAGVQPKIKVLDEEPPRRCPRCGLYQAHLQRVDHYLSVFFIPLIRVKKGTPYLYCRRCEQPVDGFHQEDRPAGRPQCRRCGADLDPGFAFCPHCGQPQK